MCLCDFVFFSDIKSILNTLTLALFKMIGQNLEVRQRCKVNVVSNACAVRSMDTSMVIRENQIGATCS